MGFEYEKKLNHPCKGLTGFELEESNGYEDIMMLRTIELHKEELKQDTNIIYFKPDRIMMKYIYDEYSSTYIDLNKINIRYFTNAINLIYLE